MPRMRSPSVTTMTSTSKRVRDEETARPPVDLAELLAAQRHDWGVDDRGHLFDVVEKETIEENFVGVFESAEIDVALEIVIFALVGSIGAGDLLVECLDLRRQESVQT